MGEIYVIDVDHRACVRRADAQDYSLSGKMGRDITRMTVGVIGTGNIGRTVLRHLSGFGCKLLAYDLYPNDEARQYARPCCPRHDALRAIGRQANTQGHLVCGKKADPVNILGEPIGILGDGGDPVAGGRPWRRTF